MKKHLLLAFSLFTLSGYAVAEEYKYITDSFAITVRTGKGTSHKIIRSLKTGEKVEVLETDPEGYTRIKMDNDMEGWVLTRYLIDQPVARDQLAAAKNKIKTLNNELDDLKRNLSETSSNAKSLSKSSTSLKKDNERLEKELAHIKSISSNQLALNEENKELKEKLLSVKREIQEIQQENISLKDSSGRHWFLIGASVVVIGIVLGLILPNLRFRRRQSWSSL
ncbi:MAG: TIGR04211 family SH3 domain-containing protein [Gammaproteobacteria bacterium]|nr:TIGR04211 family SH3 domain-containing protein [Gammaproteobacteria bacterium]